VTTFPVISVQAQFGGSWTDISSYVLKGTVTRPGTRLQGPLWQYQTGQCQVTLNNTDGRFDPDNSAGPYWGTSQTRVATFQASDTWTPPSGVTSIDKVECWGGGGGGAADSNVSADNGGGGGGAEYAAETSVAVSANTTYTLTVGTAGKGGAAASAGNAGGNGGNTTAVFGTTTVTAHGGTGGGVNTAGPTAGPGGTGGTGSSNTTHHNGGAGAAGASVGGGGGSSAGPAAAGNAGSTSTAGPAVTGGGPGGDGATGGAVVNGSTPASGPGGGGGGADSGTKLGAGGYGQAGQITLTYTVSVAQTQVLPMVPVQIQATWNSVTYPLFSGYADAWTDDGTNYAGHYDEVILTASDAFKIFSNINLPTLVSAVGAGEDSGARVNRVLDAAGWSSSLRAIDTGDTNQQGTTYGDTAMDELQLTSDTELGALYMDASGNVTFRHRQALLLDTRSNTPQAVFGDLPGTVETDGTEEKYFQVSRAEDDITLINDAQITIAGGSDLQEVTDADSVAQFLGTRTYQRSDLLLESDADALAYAGWVVYIGKDAENRFDVLTVYPGRDPVDLFPLVLGLELGDRIQIWRRPPNVAAVSKDVFIQGIAHTFEPLWWQTDYTLQSAAKYGSFFVLDDAVLGQLNENALAF
jgi:hypothetical protein